MERADPCLPQNPRCPSAGTAAQIETFGSERESVEGKYPEIAAKKTFKLIPHQIRLIEGGPFVPKSFDYVAIDILSRLGHE